MLIGFIILEMDPVLVEIIGEINMFLNSSACLLSERRALKSSKNNCPWFTYVLVRWECLKRPLDYINEALLLYHWRKNFHG